VRSKIEETKQPQSRLHFSRREVCAACGWTYAQVRTHLERLIEVELVATRAGRNGSPMLYELMIDANASEGAWQIGLIDTAKLKAPPKP
jgi:predicted ArsR family transcriptional regulator